MFSNYLKSYLRNLWKNRTYTFLNIAGLAVGITCSTLIFLWIEDVGVDADVSQRSGI